MPLLNTDCERKTIFVKIRKFTHGSYHTFFDQRRHSVFNLGKNTPSSVTSRVLIEKSRGKGHARSDISHLSLAFQRKKQSSPNIRGYRNLLGGGR
jgi:hypothetical protein